jgi:hypothetical protein
MMMAICAKFGTEAAGVAGRVGDGESATVAVGGITVDVDVAEGIGEGIGEGVTAGLGGIQAVNRIRTRTKT